MIEVHVHILILRLQTLVVSATDDSRVQVKVRCDRERSAVLADGRLCCSVRRLVGGGDLPAVSSPAPRLRLVPSRDHAAVAVDGTGVVGTAAATGVSPQEGCYG